MTKYKIAYVELDTHAEIALSFKTLMEASSRVEVDYFFSNKIKKLLGENTPNIIEASPNTILKLLSAEEYDLVVVGTVHRYFNIFDKIVKNYKTAIICHNLNFIKASNTDLLKVLLKEDTVYRLKLLLKEGLMLKNSVYQNSESCWVLSEDLASSKYQYIPLFYTEYQQELSNNKGLTLVIPGIVSQKRRDYKAVVESLSNHHFNESTEVVFLGKAMGEELGWLKSLEQKNLNNLKVTYFTEKVPQELFDEYLLKASLIWAPIQQKTHFFNITEYYGKTKVSGNNGDAMKYGKKIVFSKNIEEVLNSQNIREVKHISKQKALEITENLIESAINSKKHE
ncbi:hypothetical protein JSO61_009920 [Riemerella anatipestifer]|uniref:hypothetical protein n=1 Tax=Riemerella anatipestifer TaxID=34085 RepID=UPI0030BF110A